MAEYVGNSWEEVYKFMGVDINAQCHNNDVSDLGMEPKRIVQTTLDPYLREDRQLTLKAYLNKE